MSKSTARQQNMQQNDTQDTSMRCSHNCLDDERVHLTSMKHSGPQTRASLTTEYRSTVYVTDKWTEQPSVPPKDHRRCICVAHDPMCATCFESNQMASTVDYTSVYKNDFQPWKVKKRLPCKLTGCLKVNQGLVLTDPSKSHFQKNSVQVAANSEPAPQPFESVTSYRSDYVTHPVQPTRREKSVHNTKGLLSHPAVSLKPKAALEVNQLFQEFKTWSLENKFHGKGKAKASNFLSTTRADYTEHKCQRAKPFVPSKPTREASKVRFWGTTTMKEDYKPWDLPQRYPSVRKGKLDRPSRHHLISNEKACTCNATKTTHCPAENGALSNLERSSAGTPESRMYWTSSLDRRVTWTDGRICEAPSGPPSG